MKYPQNRIFFCKVHPCTALKLLSYYDYRLRYMKIVKIIIFVCIFTFTVMSGPVPAERHPEELMDKLQSQASGRLAICIGINEYDASTLKPLRRAANDAYGLSRVLKDQGKFRVYTFSDRDELGNKQPETNPFFPTKRNIENFLIDLVTSKDVSPNDLVVVSFSGHGINDNDGSGYLLPVDWQRDNPFDSAVAISTVTSWLKALKVTKSLIVLDACREVMNDNRSNNAISWLSGEKFGKATVSAVFYATTINGLSYEDRRTDYGAFTRYVIYGLLGKGDINNNGLVTFRELSTYVEDSLISWALQHGVSQRPYIRLLNEKCSDLVLTIVNYEQQ